MCLAHHTLFEKVRQCELPKCANVSSNFVLANEANEANEAYVVYLLEVPQGLGADRFRQIQWSRLAT